MPEIPKGYGKELAKTSLGVATTGLIGLGINSIVRNDAEARLNVLGEPVEVRENEDFSMKLGGGRVLTIQNKLSQRLDVYPEALKKLFGDSCSTERLSFLEIELTEASSIGVNGRFYYGKENFDVGYAVAYTDHLTGGERVVVAVGAFDAFFKSRKEMYPEEYFRGLDINQLKALNAIVLAHEAKGHGCLWANEEVAVDMEYSYIQNQSPTGIVPDSYGAKPLYLESAIPLAFFVLYNFLRIYNPRRRKWKK